MKGLRLPPVVLAAAVLIGAAASAADSPRPLPLRGVAEVALTGGATRLDYQSIDSQRHLLFIAHLGDDAVIAVDTSRRRVVATIPGIAAVHGVLAVRELRTVYASATGTNEVVAIDERTLRVVGRMPGGVYPDGIAYDPNTRKLFVSDERGRTETVIGVDAQRRVATIELGGEAGNTQYDPVSKRILVNVQTLGQLVEIDPSNDAIVRRTPVGGSNCIGNHGLAIDSASRRAFIACEDSGTLLALDMRTMRVTGSWDVGEDPDVVAFDAGKRLLFVAAESGVLALFSTQRSKITPIGRSLLAPYAHTVAVDPITHLAYFPLQDVGGRPVLRIMRVTE